MSLRQIKKQLDKFKQDDQDEVSEIDQELLKEKKKPTFSAFQMISDSEEEEEQDDDQKPSDQQQQEAKSKQDQLSDQQSQAKKKKKKRNKKKKAATGGDNDDQNKQQQQQRDEQKQNLQQQAKKKGKGGLQNKNENKKVDDENEFLDQIITKQKEESKMAGLMSGSQDSVLRMERKHFNYKKELKMLFAKSAQAFGALGLDEEEKEERKNRGQDSEDYEGVSKKMRRRLKMIEKIQEKNRVLQTKKYVLVQPNAEWPRVEKILTMEQVRTDKRTGQKVFSYVKSPEYVRLQKEFERVQQTNDIGRLMDFLRKNFYHHESLVYFADFLRIQGKFSDSFHFLERCLFAFEQAWTFEYQPIPPEKQQNEQFFVPQTRLDLDREHLNKVFCECIVKYIDILGRKGCSRTAFEFCKLLFSICPYHDPYGALLRVDFYTLRAREYQLFLDFVRKLPIELYPDEPSASLLILPNILLSMGLAKYQMGGGENYRATGLDQTMNSLLNLVSNLNNMLDLKAEAFVMAAILLYPGQIESLIRKVAQKQINVATKKSHFTGYQSKTWTEILTHELFTKIGEDIAGEHAYSWMLSNDEKSKLPQEKQDEVANETLNKIYQIYVSRSSSLFSPEHILLWLKEVIGYVLNKIDEGELDRDLVIAKFTSLIQSPFSLSRYRQLKTSDFTDDITTINPNELLMGGVGDIGPVNEFQNNQGQAEGGIAAQQLQQMINQLNQPLPRGRNGQVLQQFQQQQQQQIPLIEDRNFEGYNEAEIIAIQEALLAQMEDNEDIYIDEEEQDHDNTGNAVGAGGQGIMNFFNNLIWGGGNQQNNNNNNGQEEEKKE